MSNKYPNTGKWNHHLGNQNWQTPKYFVDILKENFDIRCDAATTIENPLNTKFFYTEKDNGLLQPWFSWTYVNPPYAHCDQWVKKAYFEMCDNNISSILLLPASTETGWYHKFIWNRYEDKSLDNIIVKFLFKRLMFVGSSAPAKFSNMLVIFSKDWKNRYINFEKD